MVADPRAPEREPQDKTDRQRDALQRYRRVAAELAEAQHQHPEVALRLAWLDFESYVGMAIALVDHLAAERDEAERALASAEERLTWRDTIIADLRRIVWHLRAELAARRGSVPPALAGADAHEAARRLSFACEHPIADVVSRTTELRPCPDDGRVLTGCCPFCDEEGLRVYPHDGVFGCSSCGRFGDPFSFVEHCRVHWTRGGGPA